MRTMQAMLKKHAQKKLNNKKGFTLIEIIVVLVIIGILVAVGMPAMLGFVDEARGKAFATEARMGMVAAQAVVTEVAALTGDAPDSGDILANESFQNMVRDVTEPDGFSDIEIDDDDNRVTGITYDAGTYTVEISPAGTTVTRN